MFRAERKEWAAAKRGWESEKEGWVAREGILTSHSKTAEEQTQALVALQVVLNSLS